MHSKYLQLFKELARATAVSAEQVMDYNKSKNDEKGFDVAKTLRDDYEILYDKISAEDFNGILTKADFARLAVGSYIITNNINDRITTLKKSLAGYQTDLIPKLEEVIKAENDEEAMKIAEEKFIIREETNS